MISRTITLATLQSFGSLLQGVHGDDMPKLKSMTSEQFKSPEWVNEIQLSGTFRLGGKGFASLTTPRGNFWVEEGKSSSGYKLIELDTSQSQPSALIQKGDQQAWIGFRLGMPVAVIREVASEKLTVRGGLFYVKGDKEPFNGMVMDYHEDGSKYLEWPFVNGKRHGMHIWYGDDGQISTEAPYINGKEHGMKIHYYKDGSKSSETPYVDGNANGTGIKYRQDGSKERETVYVKRKKQSEIWYREDGSKWKEMRYDTDQHNGIPTYYDENGIKKEEPPMVDGKLHGMVMGYHEDGSKSMEAPYIDGKKHGTSTWYHEDGSKRAEVSFVNGEQDGAQTWYHKNGSKSFESHYVKGKKHGMEIHYYENGNKKVETPWIQGKVNGTAIDYQEDGSKMRETDYQYGSVTLRMEWDEAGNLTKEETYPVHEPSGVGEQSLEVKEQDKEPLDNEVRSIESTKLTTSDGLV